MYIPQRPSDSLFFDKTPRFWGHPLYEYYTISCGWMIEDIWYFVAFCCRRAFSAEPNYHENEVVICCPFCFAIKPLLLRLFIIKKTWNEEDVRNRLKHWTFRHFYGWICRPKLNTWCSARALYSLWYNKYCKKQLKRRNRSIITIYAREPSAYCGGFVLCQGVIIERLQRSCRNYGNSR